MPRPALGEGLIIDYFAGGGGTSTGFEIALGRSPDIAKNHDAEALFMHQANHPETWHIHSNVWKGDPRAEVVEASRRRCERLGIPFRVLPVDIFWASPDCKHFSKAKGSKPVEKGIRDLAWVVVHVARLVRPTVIMLENVEEFRHWGPLISTDNGKLVPCPLSKGFTFKRWCRELRKLGYRLEFQERRAYLDGTPTIRKRLYVIARCDDKPISWPEATHGKPGADGTVPGGLLPWRTAADCIDWSIPCPSIFGRKKDLAENTLKRIAAGIWRYVINCADPFIVPRYGEREGQEPRTRSTRSPLGTITPDANVGSLVMPILAPRHSLFCEPCDGSGSASEPEDCPRYGSAAFMIPLTHQGGHRGQDARDPTRTVTGAHRGETAVVVARIGQTGGNGKYANDADEPLTTATSKVEHILVSAHLAGVGGRAGQSPPRASDVPTATTTAKADTALVSAHLVSVAHGGTTGRAPYAWSADDPLRTEKASPEYGVVSAHIVSVNHGDSGGRREYPATDPLGTAQADGRSQAVVQATVRPVEGEPDNGWSIEEMIRDQRPIATTNGTEPASDEEIATFIARQFGNSVGAPATDPAGATTAGGSGKSQLIAAHLTKFRKGSRGASMKHPAPTVTANGFKKRPGGAPPIGVVAAFLAQHNGGAVGHDAREALSTTTSKVGPQQVVAANLVSLKGTSRRARSVKEPSPAVTAQGWHVAEVRSFLIKYYSAAQHGQALNEPLHAATAKPRFGIVYVHGEP
ncbi:MAG: DNA cytosine methyltransferase, partial [Reyranella sp.]|nr:DNA cytosine methyltransferase [Reyranella sp.]